jgi:hypothetical protein
MEPRPSLTTAEALQLAVDTINQAVHWEQELT